MSVINIILTIICIIVAIVLIVILFILFYPFEYVIDLSFTNDDKLDLKFKYIIFKIKGFLIYKPEVSYEFKLWNKVIVKNDKGDKSDEEIEDDDIEENNSIEETDFIKNDNLSSEIKDSKTAIKELFKSAKAFEKKKVEEIKKTEEIDKEKDKEQEKIENAKKKENAANVIDKFKGIFKSDELYVIKLVVNEAIDVLKAIRPDKINVRIKYGSSDPYITGVLFSIAAPIYSMMGDNLNLKINADKDFVESYMTLIGHPRIYKIVGSILRLLINKKFRKVVFKKKK